MCSFAANYHLNFHDQLPSGLVAQLVEQRLSVPEVVDSSATGVREFFSFFLWAHFLSKANAQKVLFGISIRAFTTILNQNGRRESLTKSRQRHAAHTCVIQPESSDSDNDDVEPYLLSSNCAPCIDHVSEEDME